MGIHISLVILVGDTHIPSDISRGYTNDGDTHITVTPPFLFRLLGVINTINGDFRGLTLVLT
jgi:hypothetical protein